MNLIFPHSIIFFTSIIILKNLRKIWGKNLRKKSEEWWAKEKQRRSYLGECFLSKREVFSGHPMHFSELHYHTLPQGLELIMYGLLRSHSKALKWDSKSIQCHQHRLQWTEIQGHLDTLFVNQITTACHENRSINTLMKLCLFRQATVSSIRHCCHPLSKLHKHSSISYISFVRQSSIENSLTYRCYVQRWTYPKYF